MVAEFVELNYLLTNSAEFVSIELAGYSKIRAEFVFAELLKFVLDFALS